MKYAKVKLNDLLHEAIPAPCFQRPFVCDGRPESCNVIVIGENPATALVNDWWSFWDDDTGFNLGMFDRFYETCRQRAGKRPVSNTRMRLNRLRSRGLRCLETNAFVNEQLGGRGANAMKNDLTPDLITAIHDLRAVIAHGVVAARYLSKLSLPHGLAVHSVGHFRNLSYEKLDSIATTIV